MTLSYTLHLKLAVPDFLSEPWHAEFAAAMDSIDRALYEGIVVQGSTLWMNSTVYIIGDMVVSPDNGSIYVCAAAHTSSPAPQTLTQELIDHPTYWGALAASQLATQAEAEAGVENSHYMSPLRTRQAITAQIGSSGTLLAFTSSVSPPPTPHKGDFWYDLTTGILSAYIDDNNTLQWVAINSGGGGGGFGLGVEPQGRLTLQTGVSVMVTNQAAKTTLFYTPHSGNQIPIWNGIGFGSNAFTELSVLTTDTTKNPAAIGVSKVNDWFVWNDAGTLRLSHGVDWTNDTTRAAALSRVSGIWVNSTAIGNGPGVGAGTYVGTTRSNASSQLDWIFGGSAIGGIASNFAVWNAYNRMNVTTQILEGAASWVAPAGISMFNSSVNNRAYAVFGLSDDAIDVFFHSVTYSPTSYSNIGIGVNSTVAVSGTRAGIFGLSPTGWANDNARYTAMAPLGYNFFQMLTSCGSADAQFGGNFLGGQSGMTFNARM